MKNKIIVILGIIIALLLIDVTYADTFNEDDYYGIYYFVGDIYGSYPDLEENIKQGNVYQRLQWTGNVTLKKSELDAWINNSGNYISYGLDKISKENLDELAELSNNATNTEIKEAIGSQEFYYMIKKTAYYITITDDSGNELGKVQRYYTVKYSSITSSGENHYLCDAANPNFLQLKVYNKYLESSDDFFGSASSWFGKVKGSYTLPTQADDIINTFEDMINVVGTTAIVIATIVLGIRYIIGSVESKTSAKEGLITLLIACIFFFGWTSISNLLYGGSEYDFIFTSDTDNSYTSFVGRLFNTFTYIANVVVIGCIIYVGVKYILAGAEGRSELKGKSIYLIIGIILAFATTNVLTFISDVINETL